MRYRFIYSNVLIALIALFTSCSSSTTMIVKGVPGTNVYSNGSDGEPTYSRYDNNLLFDYPRGVINSDGYLKITQGDHAYIGLGVTVNEKGVIPFAFDYYERKAHVFNSVMAWTTIPLLGLGLPLLFMTRDGQDAYAYHYKYKKLQTTNQDLNFTFPDIVLLDPPQSTLNNDEANKNHSQTSINETVTGGNGSGVKSQKKLKTSPKATKDLTSDIVGDFVGSGTLMEKGTVIETYNGITVSIRRVETNIVGVNVIEKDGTSFFASDILYTLQKNDNGSFILREKSDKDQTIEISSAGIMQFTHTKVNIDDVLYQLFIVGHKTK